jgi:predicted RNA-binding protein with PUA-like domain
MARKKQTRQDAVARTPRCWLFKSEPEGYSIHDLARERNQTTCWDGVRNYQARNFLRDDVSVGDQVLFYHSGVKPMVVVGTMEVVKAGYPDITAFDRKAKHYDPKTDPDNPAWYMVDVRLIQVFSTPVPTDKLRTQPELAEMMVLKRGQRLSIQPVTPAEWSSVHRLAGAETR